ncbi:MAG: cell wall-binding repeat-containing protein [Egibacteraceae bacterium]
MRGLAAALTVAVLVVTAQASLSVAHGAEGCLTAASASAPIERLAGPDRFATAACASAVAYPDGAAHVLLARGDPAGGLADALAGAVLAHAVGGPVLLTPPGSLPEPTRAELQRLGPATVTVLGGTAAVSDAVEDEIVATGVDVRRVAGSGREATAAAVAAEAGAGSTAFVVNGRRPADSLVAAAPAARQGAALLLTEEATLPAVTIGALSAAQQVVIVGGHGVVSEAVEGHLRRLVGGDRVRRVAGADRGGTAASVARAFPSDGPRLLVAQADEHLVDAVTAGWAAALEGGPVLYAARDVPAAATGRYLRLGGLRAADGSEAPTRLVGGTAALTDAHVGLLETWYREARAGGPDPQLRGVWVHLFDGSLKSRTGIHRFLNAAARANLNTVVVQVARRQDAYYRSGVLPRTADPGLPADLDVLAELVPAAHERGLAVHAWMSTMPAYHGAYDGLDLGPDHVWTRHGPDSAEPWTTRTAAGDDGSYLDPGVPGVQDHVAAALAELAARYAIDAVHVDYLRYEGAAWGYHPASLDRFRAQTGAAGTPAPDNPAWQAWRRRQTGDLARRIFLEVAAVDPQVAVSLAASTMGPGPASSGGYEQTRTYRDVFQDWPSWLAAGTIDIAFPMNYFREHDAAQRRWFDDWVAFESGLAGPVAVGQAGYLNGVPGSLAQLGRATAATDGAVLYSYQQTTAGAGPGALLDALATDPFRDPAPPPVLRSGAAPGPTAQAEAAAGHLVVRAVDGLEVRAHPAAGRDAVAGQDAVAVRADATGRAGFPNLAPGRWTVRAPGHETATVEVAAGAVAELSLRATALR